MSRIMPPGLALPPLRRVWVNSGEIDPLTGTTSETALATIAIPARVMGSNGLLRVTSVWTSNNSANNKTARVRFGGLAGTPFMALALSSTTITLSSMIRIHNLSATSQIGGSAVAAGLGSSTASNITASVDTTAAVDLVLSGTLANAADTLELKSYLVELLRPDT